MSIEFIIICILAAVIAPCLTAFGCRYLHQRHYKLSWYLAAIAAMCAGFFAVFFFFGGDIFSFSAWNIRDKEGIVLVCFVTISCIGFIPSFLVLSFIRGRFRKDDHVA